jgi:transposase
MVLSRFGRLWNGSFRPRGDRRQDYLLPAALDDYVSEDNPVRAIEAFIHALDLKALEFAGMTPAGTGHPAYHPATMLKIYLYGYLNRVQSSRRLEREAPRNIELMWLTGRLAPDFKTIANFRRVNGAAIRSVCSQFIVLCRQLGLFTRAVVAIDGSKMKAVNNRDKNYTAAKVASRMKQVQDNIDRYRRACPPAPLRSACGQRWRRRQSCTNNQRGPLNGGLSDRHVERFVADGHVAVVPFVAPDLSQALWPPKCTCANC